MSGFVIFRGHALFFDTGVDEMRLSTEEYARGLLYWTIAGDAQLWTTTADDPSQLEQELHGPLTNPNGSKVTSPPKPYVKVTVNVQDPSALKQPFEVRWERLVGPAIKTDIWTNDLETEPMCLTHIPNRGVFHRLVIATPFLGWEDDAVIRVGDVVIRLRQGTIIGERIQPIDQVTVEEGKISMSGAPSGSAEAQGRFIEIIAPGDSLEDAERLAYSLLGLMALCIGDHVVGNIVFSEPYHTSGKDQLGELRIPVVAQVPRQAEMVELDTVDLLLPHLLAEDRVSRARRLALAWYERGIQAGAPIDQLLSYFIGIETIVNAYAAEHGPVDEARIREERFNRLRTRFPEEFDEQTTSLLIQRLTEPTITERFRYYAAGHGWEDEIVNVFRALARLRNDALHGNPADVNEEHARQSERVLVRLLKAELGLLGEMPWEKQPRIGSVITVEYSLARSQEEPPGPGSGQS